MSKKTIVRRDAPHEVSMPAGSRDASSRARDKATEARPSAPPARRMVRTPKTEPVVAARSASVAPPVRTPRGKTLLGNQVSDPGVDAPASGTVTAHAHPLQREPRSDKDLWSADSTILHQLGRLKARNAQVSEQIQRLQQPAAQPGGPLK